MDTLTNKSLLQKPIQGHKRKRRGILLFSGGFDSTLAALLLTNNNVDLIGLTINYPGRPEGEKQAVKSLSKQLAFSRLLEVSIDGSFHLLDSTYKSTCLEGWIPYRNVMFWSIAAHQAVSLNADFVAAGHDDEDDGKIFNDATKDFFLKLKDILRFSGNGNLNSAIDIILPIVDSSEEQLLSYLEKQNLELLLKTWSCWRNDHKQCKQCHACKQRDKYLKQLNRIRKCK